MTTTAESLIDTMVAILQGDASAAPPILPPTAVAAVDVQPYRLWSIQTLTGPFNPKITFDLPQEDKDSLGRNGPASFTVIALITLRAFVSAKSGAAVGSDGGETRVRQALIALRRQIEVAIIDTPALMSRIQQIKAVRSKLQGGQDSNGVHLGELAIQFALEFYQDADDFAQLTFDELDDLNVALALGDDTVATTDIILNP